MKNFLIALIVVVVLGGGYYLWQGGSVSSAPGSSSQTENEMPSETNEAMEPSESQDGTKVGVDVEVGGSVSAPMAATVTYNGDSFSPSEVTIKKGGTVTWRNTSGGKMWVASAQHPSHTVYAGTSREEHCPDASGAAFDQCAGETGNYSFTFQKTGTWNYHDHLNAQLFGKVIVVE